MKLLNRQIILPPLLGLLVAFTSLFIFQQTLNKFYFAVDPDPVFEFSVTDYLAMYLMAFVPILLIAVFFQLLIASPIWNKYKKGRKFLYLKLWQLLIVSSLIFGGIISTWAWDSYFGTKRFVLIFSTSTIIALIYWIVNIQALKFVERES